MIRCAPSCVNPLHFFDTELKAVDRVNVSFRVNIFIVLLVNQPNTFPKPIETSSINRI